MQRIVLFCIIAYALMISGALIYFGFKPESLASLSTANQQLLTVGAVGGLILIIGALLVGQFGTARHSQTVHKPKPPHKEDNTVPEHNAGDNASVSDLLLDKFSAETLEARLQSDFRTPLNGMMGALDLLKHTPLTSEQETYLSLVQQSMGELLKQTHAVLSDVMEREGLTVYDGMEEALDFELLMQLDGHDQKKPKPDLRILLVEDNAMNQTVTYALLKKLGYTQVVLASNGKEAISAFQEKPYELILMDCQMPEMDGYEASKTIRTLPNGDKTKIAALTASVTEHNQKKAREHGMDSYFTKPITEETLGQIIKWAS